MDAVQFKGATFGSTALKVDAAERFHIVDRQGAEIVCVIGKAQGNLGFIRYEAQIGNLVIGAKQQSGQAFLEVQLDVGTRAKYLGSWGELQAWQVCDPTFHLNIGCLLMDSLLKWSTIIHENHGTDHGNLLAQLLDVEPQRPVRIPPKTEK
ncbi:hypothetical protein BLA27_24660 [Brucella cytisi]|uniref:Uncharacterized protein n=1 Tax=Brucella cytisi TaxID=407152 RepID=A0A1J6HW13_9HYPH|nr:hypothetical protein BLA27_24660 [Brucella cytisi]